MIQLDHLLDATVLTARKLGVPSGVLLGAGSQYAAELSDEGISAIRLEIYKHILQLSELDSGWIWFSAQAKSKQYFAINLFGVVVLANKDEKRMRDHGWQTRRLGGGEVAIRCVTGGLRAQKSKKKVLTGPVPPSVKPEWPEAFGRRVHSIYGQISDTADGAMNYTVLNHEQPTALLPRPEILVVDDDSSNRMLLRVILESLQYQVTEAIDGEQALSIVERNVPDLVLMDLAMPCMSGTEAIKRMRASGARMPAYAVTGHADEETLQILSQEGFDGRLLKPFSRKSIQLLLNDLVFSGKSTADRNSKNFRNEVKK